MIIELGEIRIQQSEITENSYWVTKLDGEGTEIIKDKLHDLLLEFFEKEM